MDRIPGFSGLGPDVCGAAATPWRPPSGLIGRWENSVGRVSDFAQCSDVVDQSLSFAARLL
jgi:hypothetical protein